MSGPRPSVDPGDAQAVRSIRLIAFALMGGVAMFLLAAAVISGGTLMPPPPSPGAPVIMGIDQTIAMLVGIAGLLGFTAVPMSFVFKRVGLSRGRDEATGRVPVGVWSTVHLIALALVEGFGLIGPIAMIIGRSILPGAAIGLAALPIMLLHFPSRRSYEREVLGRREPSNPYATP